jgi:hypothetical protein
MVLIKRNGSFFYIFEDLASILGAVAILDATNNVPPLLSKTIPNFVPKI